jgi:hypothetical protein
MNIKWIAISICLLQLSWITLVYFTRIDGRHIWKKSFTITLFFYVFLTVHLCIILVGNLFNVQFLLWYVYLNPLHASSNSVLVLRRTVVLIQLLVQSLCVSGRPVRRSRWNWFHLDLHTGRPLTYFDYTKNCINTVFLLRLSTELLEIFRGVKHIIEEIVHKVGYLTE